MKGTVLAILEGAGNLTYLEGAEDDVGFRAEA